MAKGDYKDSTTKTGYGNSVRRQTLTKVSVASEEKRDRAELLDMVEELFETGDNSITAAKLRAFCHMLVKSTQNTSDDTVHLDGDSTATLPFSDPAVAGKLWNNRGVLTISRG